MLVVRISRKLMSVCIVIVLLIFSGFGIHKYIQDRRDAELAERYEALICCTGDSDNTCIIAFLTSANAQTRERRDIEIFDINKGSVIKKVASSSTIQEEAEKILTGITGMYVKVKAIPDKGYMIKIPLKSSVNIQNQWLNGLVNEIIVIFPMQEKPYLLVLDEEKRPFFYTFEANTDKLLDNLDFQIEDIQDKSPAD